jgi:hypothetical protein
MAGLSSRQLAIATILLVALSVGAFGRVVENGYAFQAVPLVQLNPLVRPDASVAAIFSSPYWSPEIAPGHGLYRPLSVLSFQLTRRLQADPIALDHAIDLGLHALCSLALLIFLAQMGTPFGVALTLSAIFVLHPVQTEVVASLVGRSDLLATLFALLALVLALSRRARGPLLGVGLFVLFSLSLLAKESAVTLFVLLPACWAARASWRGTPWAEIARHALGLALCLFLALVCNVILREAVLGNLLISEPAPFQDGLTGFFEVRWRALAYATLFGQKLLWPLPLLPDYLTGVIPTKGFALNLRAAIAGVALLASFAWAGWGGWQHRTLTRGQLGIVLFWIAIAPVSNLILQLGTPFGERLLYFPMLFLLLAAVDLPLWERVRIPSLGSVPRVWPVWILLWILLGFSSATRIADWKDDRTLFEAAVGDCPENYESQFAYANIVYRSGLPADRDRAKAAMVAAARIIPSAYTPRVALGVMAQEEGNDEQALARFEEAWARADSIPDLEQQAAALNLARTYRRLEKFQALEAFIEPVAAAHPDWSELEAELIDYWRSRGRLDQVLAIHERALERDPADQARWRQVIWAELKLGQDQRAAERLAVAPVGTVTELFKRQLQRDGLSLPVAASTP